MNDELVFQHNGSLTTGYVAEYALRLLEQPLKAELIGQFALASQKIARAEFAGVIVNNWRGSENVRLFTADVETSSSHPQLTEHFNKVLNGTESFPFTSSLGVETVAAILPQANRGVVCLPIIRVESLLGYLVIAGSGNEGGFGPEIRQFMAILANSVGLAIHFINLLHRQQGLIRGIVKTHEEERKNMGYDLHDGLTQKVFAAHAYLEAYLGLSKDHGSDEHGELLQKASRCLDFAVTESRRLVGGLTALALEQLGLASALQRLVTEGKAQFDWLSATLDENLGSLRFEESIETTIFRIAQESINNAGKHARTKEIDVSIKYEPAIGTSPGILALVVQDAGVGFDAASLAIGDYHVGLHSMRERVSLLDGVFAVHSTPGSGTRVSVELPATPI